LAAVALNAVELAVPRLPFLPWLKPGFANIVTLMWVMKYGFRDAMLYTALRVWISGFYFGFSLFTLSLSLSGGLLSTAAMFAVWATLGRRGLTGTVGMAMVGALFHNIGQLAVIYMIMLQNAAVLCQIPFMLCSAVVFGGLVGTLAPSAGKILGFGINTASETVAADSSRKLQDFSFETPVIAKLIIVATFAVSISLMFVGDPYILTAAMIACSSISFSLNRRTPSVLIYPLRFYALFLFIAFTNLLFSYGKRIDIIPFITVDGLTAFLKQSARVWCWLQTVHILKRFNFHSIFISMLHKFFPAKRDTIEAGFLALEYFPEVMRISKSSKKLSAKKLITGPKAALAEFVETVAGRIAGEVKA
jgi:heptaprenyl diphosphate synthase